MAAATVLGGASGLLFVIAMAERNGIGGENPINLKVRNVALAVFVGSLCFAGAALTGVLTLPPQIVALGGMTLGGLIYLVTETYHDCVKREAREKQQCSELLSAIFFSPPQQVVGSDNER